MFEKEVWRSGRGGNGGPSSRADPMFDDSVVVFSGAGAKNMDSPYYVPGPDLPGPGTQQTPLPKPPAETKPGVFKSRSNKGAVPCSAKPPSMERELDMENCLGNPALRANPSAGFVLTALLVMLPVFLTGLMGLCTLLFCLKNYNLSQSFCISQALQSQRDNKQKLTELLSLNPRANSLRTRYRRHLRWLKKHLKTGNLVSAGVIAARIKAIQWQRVKLHHRQQKIFHQSLKKIKQNVEQFHKKMLYFASQRIKARYLKPYPLAVRATGSRLAPTWQLAPGFSQKQTVALFWDMPLYRFLPDWLKRWLFKPDVFSSHRCSATLKKNKGHLQVALTFYKKSTAENIFESLAWVKNFGGLK